MAYIRQNERRKDPNAPGDGGSSAFATGDVLGGGAAGGGTGGLSNYTNIQSYLNANRGASNYGVLKDKVGSRVGDARNDAQTGFTDFRYKADEAAGRGAVDRNQFQTDLQTAYRDPTQFQSQYAFRTYEDPGSYSYAIDSDLQDLGQSAQTKADFNRRKQQEYARAGTGSYGIGLGALDSQIDSVDPRVNQFRQELLQDYGNLETEVADINQGASDYATTARNRFGENQDAYRSLLNETSGNLFQTMDDYRSRVNANAPSFYSYDTGGKFIRSQNNPAAGGYGNPDYNQLLGITDERTQQNILSGIEGSGLRNLGEYQTSPIVFEDFGADTNNPLFGTNLMDDAGGYQALANAGLGAGFNEFGERVSNTTGVAGPSQAYRDLMNRMASKYKMQLGSPFNRRF